MKDHAGILELVMNMENDDVWEESEMLDVVQYLRNSKKLKLPEELNPIVHGM